MEPESIIYIFKYFSHMERGLAELFPVHIFIKVSVGSIMYKALFSVWDMHFCTKAYQIVEVTEASVNTGYILKSL